jgi:endonuclease YncB( thermonuclease family)
MSYKLIKGEFHIFYPDLPRMGPEPDGDTLKFLPDNPSLVEDLNRPGGIGPAFNGRRMINLRFEGIDALETHFDDMHQNLQWARAARDAVLQNAGFGQIEFWDDLPHKVKSVENHPRRGYIYTKTLDSHGRIVAFVYSGNTYLVDGSDVFVDVQTLEQSLNAKLIKESLVYPAFYSSLPIDLKDRLAELAAEARNNAQGLWPEATANIDQATEIPDLATLQDLVIWPKMFRRLARYFAAGHNDLAHFDLWLRADPRDRDDRLILPNRELGNMHDIFEVVGNQIRMIFRPEDLIILPDDSAVPVAEIKPKETCAIRIIAALVNPIGPEKGQEKVILLNASPQQVDVTGWEIADRANGRQQLQGAIDAGAIVQVTLSQKVRLGNKGDTITLFDDSDNHIDQVSYTEKQAKREGWTIIF